MLQPKVRPGKLVVTTQGDMIMTTDEWYTPTSKYVWAMRDTLLFVIALRDLPSPNLQNLQRKHALLMTPECRLGWLDTDYLRVVA